MDDGIILLKTKKEAVLALEKIREFLNKNLKLELNNKTQIFKSSQGVNFCGYKINEYRLKIREKGLADGLVIGIEKEKKAVIKKLHELNISVEQIAKIVELKVEEVKAILNEKKQEVFAIAKDIKYIISVKKY